MCSALCTEKKRTPKTECYNFTKLISFVLNFRRANFKIHHPKNDIVLAKYTTTFEIHH